MPLRTSIRTTETMVTFRRPFTLSAVDGVQPAGIYRLVIDEEQIPGLSFVAFRRMTTMLHLPANPSPSCKREVVNVDPAELAEALAADAS
jgi:hypothetical protein